MARLGNFDVTYNPQGWFDTTLADPLNGWLVDDAIGGPKSQPQVAAHGGFVTRAPRPPVLPAIAFEENYGDRFAAFMGIDPANDTIATPAPIVGILDRFGPVERLPEKEFLVAGNIEESKTNWLLVGAAVALGVGVGMALAKKSGTKAPKRRRTG